MNGFHSAREAKEFLASKIVEEARRESTPLSEVERKMLYFSETDWTLPDISAVSDEFDRTYDQDEYEQRIANLIKEAYNRVLRAHGTEYEDWCSAVRLLSQQDHYLLVMIKMAGLRPRGDQLKLLGAGVSIVALIFSITFLSLSLRNKYGVDLGKYWPSRDETSFVVWAGALVFAVITTVLYYAARARRPSGVMGKLAARLVRIVNGGS